MKGPKSLLLLLCIATLCGMLSCKKKSKNSSTNYKLGLIDVIHSTSVSHYHIFYDTYNNVDSMIIIGGGTDTGQTARKTFNYFGSSFSVTDGSGSTTTILASTTGLILSIYTLYDSISFIYNGTLPGEMDNRIPSSAYPYFTKIITNYAWNNGDMIVISSGSTADSVDYDISKAGQVGDALRINDFLSYGKPYIKSAHMPTQITKAGVWQEKYFYQYDGQGRISQLVLIKNNFGVGIDDSTFYAYQYYAL